MQHHFLSMPINRRYAVEGEEEVLHARWSCPDAHAGAGCKFEFESRAPAAINEKEREQVHDQAEAAMVKRIREHRANGHRPG